MSAFVKLEHRVYLLFLVRLIRGSYFVLQANVRLVVTPDGEALSMGANYSQDSKR